MDVGDSVLNDIEFDRVLITGHKYSDIDGVEQALFSMGMKEAIDLDRRGISPGEISSIIKSSNKTTEGLCNPIQVNSVWNDLVVDLLVSNRKLKFWGWADTEAVALLDYFKSCDDRLAFLFVCVSPKEYFDKILAEGLDLNCSSINKCFSHYVNYYRNILNFYYKNSNRSVIFLSSKLHFGGCDSLRKSVKKLGFPIESSSYGSVASQNVENKSALLCSGGWNSVNEYLFEDFIAGSEIAEIYSEILSCLEEEVERKSPHPVSVDREEALLLSFSQAQSLRVSSEKLQDLENEKQKNIGEIQNLNYVIGDANEKIRCFKDEVSKNSEKIQNLDREISSLKMRVAQFEQQKKGFEDSLKQSGKELDKQKNVNSELSSKYLNASVENDLLIRKLISSQRSFLKAKGGANLGCDRKEKKDSELYGAADRVKGYLCYRIGAVIVNNYSSFPGVITIPFKLVSETRAYRRELKSFGSKRPPLRSYADYSESERVKKHLSYLIGSELLSVLRKPYGIFAWPYAIVKARKIYLRQKNV